jgi:hypothetical protein
MTLLNLSALDDVFSGLLAGRKRTVQDLLKRFLMLLCVLGNALNPTGRLDHT